ncbi:MAG: septal ring lytic transglycosylase RlpA family protein [Gallionellaceae bacterium]|nr:septal ring lytic transglycosylase RlpA family protein [Gallionellaceae bacterium]
MKIRQFIPLALIALLLAACGTTSPRSSGTPGKSGGGYLSGDGPHAEVPANLAATPDAVPRAEPLHAAATRPYTVLGKTYYPLNKIGDYKVRGIASWYGKKFHGQKTANGETYDMYAMTAAHPTLPIPSYVRVTNLSNGRSVVVRVNDRGPFMHNRLIDLSYVAAYKLDLLGKGSGEVEVESLIPGTGASPLVATSARSEPLVTLAPIFSEPLPPASMPVAAPPDGTAYLQLGAFQFEQGAASFLVKLRDELDLDGTRLSLSRKDNLVRVYFGPYASADEARADAARLESRLGFKPVVTW